MEQARFNIVTKYFLFKLFREELPGLSMVQFMGLMKHPLNHYFAELLRKDHLKEKDYVIISGFDTRFFHPPLLEKIITASKQMPMLLVAEDREAIIKSYGLKKVESGDISDWISQESMVFTPEAYEEWRREGLIFENFRFSRATFPCSPKKGYPNFNYTPAQNFVMGRYSTKEAEVFFPLLLSASRILNASPRGTTNFIDAARIAAMHGANREELTTLLLLRDFPEDEANWMTSRDPIIEFLLDALIKYNIAWQKSEMYSLAQISDLADDIARIRKGQNWEIRECDQLSQDAFSKRLMEFAEIFRRPPDLRCYFSRCNVWLEYLSFELARLKNSNCRSYNRALVEKSKILLAPLAEASRYDAIASEMRDEIFRVSSFEEYKKLKKRIESIYQMTYAEMNAHLQYVADLLEQVFSAVGIPKSEFRIVHRVKTPYSVHEKMSAYDADDPCFINDVLGLLVIAAKDSEIFRYV
ncbi:hypothetical protein KKB18_10055, partial [bacterium]|nr:hypothetical protein [bacterium]